jgi:hypothetical protein
MTARDWQRIMAAFAILGVAWFFAAVILVHDQNQIDNRSKEAIRLAKHYGEKAK